MDEKTVQQGAKVEAAAKMEANDYLTTKEHMMDTRNPGHVDPKPLGNKRAKTVKALMDVDKPGQTPEQVAHKAMHAISLGIYILNYGSGFA